MKLPPKRLAVVGAVAAALMLLTGCVAADSPASGASASAPSPLATAAPTSPTPAAAAPATPAPSASTRPTPARTAPAPAPAARGSAAQVLATLRVAGRGPLTGYDRNAFGPAWNDVDRNGCDTRNDVLRRDLTRLVLKPGTRGCAVESGLLADPFTATGIRFARGGPSEVDVDHVVALGNAWVTGAARWDGTKRLTFANDPLNLLAVQASANRQKGDGDAATWLPSNKRYGCAYVARQVAVKARYSLAVTPAERDAVARVLAGCPRQVVPTDGTRFPVGRTVTYPPVRMAPATAPRTQVPASSSRTDPRFETCGEAINAGFGPYVRGRDAEYPWYRDSDSDGTVCE